VGEVILRRRISSIPVTSYHVRIL